MRRRLWLVLLMALIAGHPSGRSPEGAGSAPPRMFRNLVLSPSVSDNLALLFAQFDSELVLCLEGERRGPDLYITDFRMPHILISETGRVQASACKPDARSVGTWHNHPAPGVDLISSREVRVTENCYLSRTDIADFRRRSDAQVSMVSCGPRTYAYWTRADVATVSEDAALLPPPAGQLVRAQPGTEESVTDLTQARRR